MDQEWITIEEAASKMGVSERTIFRRIESGLYPSKKDGNRKRLVSITHQNIIDGSADLTHSLNAELQLENKWLRDRVEELTSLVQQRGSELDATRHRQDAINASLANTLETQQKLLEYQRSPWYVRLKKVVIKTKPK